MAESIFEQDLKRREKDQEEKKSKNGLRPKAKSKKIVPERIYLSLPSDYKERFVKYCKEQRKSTSVQLREWIDEFC